MNEPEGFEWDSANEREHFEKHSIRFAQGLLVFLDPNRFEVIDDRNGYGEMRFNVIGRVGASILNVTYTMRDKAARIISVRRASQRERKNYAANNFG